MKIKMLSENEYEAALNLVWRVFLEFEAPDYAQQGIDEFYSSVNKPDYIAALRFYGCFDGKTLVGTLATRSNGSHIALFFVDAAYQKRGIGKALFNAALKNCHTEKITVNSSPFAVPVYHALGFRDTDCEQTVNSIRFTPMEYYINEK